MGVCLFCGNDATGRTILMDEYCLDCLFQTKFTNKQIEEFKAMSESLAEAGSEAPQDWRTWTPEMIESIGKRASDLMELKLRIRRDIFDGLNQYAAVITKNGSPAIWPARYNVEAFAASKGARVLQVGTREEAEAAVKAWIDKRF
jgi:hypothetical protein